MTTEKTDKEISIEALDEAIAILKEKGLRLTKELKITRGAIWQWKLEGREIPAEHCAKIQALTGGRVTAERLNRKVFGAPATLERAGQ
jgi:DNA-binding transcriptional regulator YdaS (Cro superfamily)